MPTAHFQAKFSQSAIDAENGVISGVKVMQLGKDATFMGEDGKPKTVKITPEHISALLGFAGNRTVPSHWTHDYFGKPEDTLNAKVGGLRNFSKDSDGNLVANLHLSPGPHRDTALWNAANDPDGMMLSAVFDYGKKDPNCIPLNFRAADLVSEGAATTALFSEATQPETKMPITLDDLKEVCSTPEGKEMLRSAIKGHDNAEAQMEDSAAAEMEKDGGVKDEDKKPEDEQKPALMRAALRCNRAHVRQSRAVAADETALLAKVDLQAKASATALLGNGKFLNIGEDGKTGDEVEIALTAQIAAGAKDRATAIFRLAKDKPALYNAAVKAGKL